MSDNSTLRELDAKLDQVEQELLGGAAKDFAQYRYLVGLHDGLRHIKDFIKERQVREQEGEEMPDE